MDIELVGQLCLGCFAQRPQGATVCLACGYDEAVGEVSLHHLPPRTILSGKYLTGKVLGEGGFGITYIGFDLNLDLKVAIKEFYPLGFVTRSGARSCAVQPLIGEKGEQFARDRDKFVGEAKRLAKFRSLPGIVMVHDFFHANGTAYIVMDYVDGMTLKAYLEQMGGKLPAAMLLELMRPMFESLARIHKTGIIHRDISPDNIRQGGKSPIRAGFTNI
jgi:serine/threonine protein kinase